VITSWLNHIIMVLARIILLLIFNIERDINGEYVVSGCGSESDQDDFLCCAVGNQSFYSIDDALKSVTDNIIITIQFDVVLSSKIVLEGIENITLVGDNNPTIDCKRSGAVKFAFCNKVTVNNITWKSCGLRSTSIYPGIEFYKSSNIAFKHCRFHNSTGQAIVLSNVSGNVSINHCYFLYNNQFQDHGSVISLSRNFNSFQFQLVIDNCNFSFNGAATSLIYVSNSVRTQTDYIYVQNSLFSMNVGVPIYVSRQNLHFYGSIVFQHNKANSGGGIFSTASTITFNNESHVEFTDNLAKTEGGVLYLENS